MGATVTTSKQAAAFRASTGEVYYCLFEETYEKNCYPHAPHWGALCIGTIDQALRRVFRSAGACEGGGLQGPHGEITPEGYIAAWMRALASPAEMPNLTVDLRVAERLYAVIPAEEATWVREQLADIGRGDIATILNAGETHAVRLHEEPQLLARLFDGSRLGAWRAFGSCYAPAHSQVRPDLGYAPTPAGLRPIPVPEYYRVTDDHFLVRDDSGLWRGGNSPWGAVGEYVGALWETELREPGSWRRHIKAYREGFKQAPSIPAGTKVVVDRSIPVEGPYYEQNVVRFADKHPVTTTDAGYEFAVPSAMDSDLQYDLYTLPRANTSWVILETGAVAATHPPAAFGQQDLFAA